MKTIRILEPFLLFATIFSTVSCVGKNAAPPQEAIHVLYTPSTQVWLAGIQTCAGDLPIIAEASLLSTIELDSRTLVIRIGGTELPYPAYRIEDEEILVVVNAQNPIDSLTIQEVAGLFSGALSNWNQLQESAGPVNVWVYSTDDDIAQIFSGAVLQGTGISPSAYLAPGAGEMVQRISSDVNAVGILPRRWLTSDVKSVYAVAAAPLLVYLSPEADDSLLDIIYCLQK